jgi:RuvA, C-terminal domain/HNH endonuclease
MMHQDQSAQGSSSEGRDTQQPRTDWRRAHEELSRLARCRARLDWEEGRSLLDALRSGAHLHLGFGSFGEYVERLLGYKQRSTDERLRVAEAVQNLPELGQALREGRVTWSVVRELTRVATPENEHAWLDVARGRTVRQIEELVAGHMPGDRPEDAYGSSLRRHVLRFEVSADTFATFGEAMAKLRRASGSRLDDDAALLLLARQTLGGPNEPGRATYQIGLTVCEECGRGWQQGRSEMVEVGSDIVEMANCDAQHLGRIDPQPAPVGNSGQCEDTATSAAHACLERETVRVVDAGERKSAHVGARASRARQDVPPAVRRLVMRRDGGRCVVPGCSQGVFVDIHHVVPRSEGGDHDPDRLAVLCCAHHRALHRGQLIIEGRVSAGLVFRHADGTKYGHVVHPRAAAILEEAFRALRSLGFRESEARRALESVRAKAHVGDPSIQGILRQALTWLASDRQPPRVVVDVR